MSAVQSFCSVAKSVIKFAPKPYVVASLSLTLGEDTSTARVSNSFGCATVCFAVYMFRHCKTTVTANSKC